jgi:hypothetical protein
MASPRVTVDARTATSTSSSFGTGRATSATRSTSGGPYRSWTTDLILPFLSSLASAAAHTVVHRGSAVKRDVWWG